MSTGKFPYPILAHGSSSRISVVSVIADGDSAITQLPSCNFNESTISI